LVGWLVGLKFNLSLSDFLTTNASPSHNPSTHPQPPQQHNATPQHNKEWYEKRKLIWKEVNLTMMRIWIKLSLSSFSFKI
jgi:hypothetical protein